SGPADLGGLPLVGLIVLAAGLITPPPVHRRGRGGAGRGRHAPRAGPVRRRGLRLRHGAAGETEPVRAQSPPPEGAALLLPPRDRPPDRPRPDAGGPVGALTLYRPTRPSPDGPL